MKVYLDGERSKLRLGFAKRVLHRVQLAKAFAKTIDIDGFRISVRANPPAIKIVAPVGVVATCVMPSATTWFVAESPELGMVGHPWQHCTTRNADGSCAAWADIPNKTQSSAVGVSQRRVNIGAAFGEFLQAIGAYDTNIDSSVEYLQPAHAFGSMGTYGDGLQPVVSLNTGSSFFGIAAAMDYFGGLLVYNSFDITDATLAEGVFTALWYDTTKPPNHTNVQLTAMDSMQLEPYILPAGATGKNIWHWAVVTGWDGTTLEVSVLYQISYTKGTTTLYYSSGIMKVQLLKSGSASLYKTVFSVDTQTTDATYIDWGWSYVVGAPYVHMFNKVTFTDLGVSVTWGLWDHTDPTSAGMLKLDHVPMTDPAAGYPTAKYDFLNGASPSEYQFPADIFAANVRPEYIRFPVATGELWFMVMRQFAAPLVRTSTVLSAWIGTPKTGWTSVPLPTNTYEVRLTHFDTTLATTDYELMAIADGVSATGVAGVYVWRQSKGVWRQWMVVDPKHVPAVPAQGIWSLGLYGDAVTARNKIYSTIPMPPNIPTPWGV